MIAGRVTKKNVLGFVASFPIPKWCATSTPTPWRAQREPQGHDQGHLDQHWFDPSKERQAAETLIGQGADVLLQNTDSSAVLQTAQDKGVNAFGWTPT